MTRIKAIILENEKEEMANFFVKLAENSPEVIINREIWKVIQSTNPINRINVPISNGFQILSLKDITYCEAENTYTYIHLNKEKKILVTKPLADISKKLPADKFCRIHRAFMVNLDYVRFFKKDDGGIVVLEDGTELTVARARRDEFLRQLSENM